MKKLILTDLDHTLLRTDGTVSERTLDVLRKCRGKGVLFAIATARYWIGAERYIELLAPDYEITTDGTLIHSAEECIYSCEMSEAAANGIVAELLKAVQDTLESLLLSLQEESNHVLRVELNMGLDNIILREDLTSVDVLKLML